MARVSARPRRSREKTRKRVLVVGKVEDDASIRYGCFSRMTNNDLVRLAACEQADAETRLLVVKERWQSRLSLRRLDLLGKVRPGTNPGLHDQLSAFPIS